MRVVEQSAAVPFSSLARLLVSEVRGRGLVTPSFSTPPRVPGANRTVRKMQGGGLMVAVRVRDRDLDDVMADMVDGVLLANGFTGQIAEGWRLALLSVLDGPAAAAA